MPQKQPIIAYFGCPEKCSAFQERRVGKYGGFYFCHRCQRSIAEGALGGVAEPVGTCRVCGGLLFWRVNPDGTRFQACWSPELHIGRR